MRMVADASVAKSASAAAATKVARNCMTPNSQPQGAALFNLLKINHAEWKPQKDTRKMAWGWRCYSAAQLF
jgi:hypothetical protein